MGLGAAFALVGLLGGVTVSLGAAHDSLIRDASLFVAFILGGSLYAYLRRRALVPQVRRAVRVAVVAAATASWMVAAVCSVAPAALFGDAIDAALGGGAAGFAVILLMIGLVGGAVGGGLEGFASRTRLDRDTVAAG